MKICFLDKTEFQYNSNDLYSYKLRGAETVIINLANELNNLGHEIFIISNCYKDEKINNILWKNIDNYNENILYDICIANADIGLFDKVHAKKKILFSHSLQSLEKFIRKKQLLPYIKHKPIVVTVSEYHKKNRSKLISLFGQFSLGWAVDQIFINTELNNNIDKNLSIFTSRPDRNLDLLLKLWIEHIFPNYPQGKLLITPTSNKVYKQNNIFLRETGAKSQLIKDLLKSKILLLPGHKAELYCLTAEEAKELCVPIITLGIGSLSERITHGKTGFIAKNHKEFAEYTIELFKNDKLWLEIRNNLINLRGSNNWNNVAKDFLYKTK